MKSKVILFCVLLFCSKFVDSVPHSEELVRQRAFQPTNWPANNYAAGQYVDTNFAQTQNENILKNSGLQLENNQDYYANQRTRGFESQGYNKGLSSSLLGKERLLNYAPSVEEERVNSYPIRSNSYPSSAPQIGLDNQQFGFQNWRPQNQYANPGPIQEVIPINDRPLVRTVQEPYRGPVQYVKPQYIPPVNRRHYPVDRFYPAREQLQYPIENIGLPGSVSTKYVQTSAPVSVVRESVPYDNYGNNQGTASENAGVVASKQFLASESGSPYNGAPDVISSEVLAEQSRNNGYELNQSSQSDSANTADVATIVNDSQDVVAAESFNAENRPSTLLPVENKSEAAAIIQKVLADKPLVHRYANNYRPGSNWNNYAREGSYNGASVSKTNTFEIHSGNANNNYGSEFVPKKPAPLNTYSKPASSHVVATSNLGHKNAEAVPQYTSTTPAPLENTDSENNFYRQLTSGIHKYDLKNIASHPKIKDLLAVNNKPYVLIHANGSVEYFDKFDIDAKENSKYRLIHTKHTPSGKPQGANGVNVVKPQSPTFIPTSTTTPAPSQLANGGISKPPPSSNEWTDESSYLSKPADDKTPELSPLYRKRHDADNYSTSPHPHVKLPAGNDDSATTFSNVNQPQNDIYSQTLVSKESHSSNGDQPDKNENFKPTASDDGLNSDDVNKSDDDSTPKPLVSDSQSSNSEDSKPGFASANQSNKSNNGHDDTKSLPHKVIQPDDDSTPKPQSLDHGKQAPKEKQSYDDDDDLSSISNVKQPYDDSTSKSQNKQIVNGDDSKPVSSKDNQSDNDNSKNPQSPKGNQQDNDDFSSDNVKWSDDNSNTKPQSSKDNKSPNGDDSKPFPSDDNKSNNGDDNKPQKQSPKDNQPDDESDDSSSKSNVNGKNDQSIKKGSKPSPSDDYESDNSDDNKLQKHSPKDNQPDDGDDSFSTSNVNGKNDQSIKEDSKPFSSDDSESDNSDNNKPQKHSTKDNQSNDNDDDSSSSSNVNGKNDQSIKKDSQPSPSDGKKSDSIDDNKPQKHSPKDNQPNDNDDNSSSTSDVNGKNDESIKKDSQPSLSDDNESDNSDDNKPQKHSPRDKQPDDDSDDSSSNANGKNDQSSPKKDNQSPKQDDANSSPSKVTESHDDSNSSANDSPVDDEKPKSTTPSSSKTDDNQTSTTSSPVASDQSTPSNKENSVTSTTALPDATTEDEIITLSPIETATDNVSDAPSTTTTGPNKSHPRFHIGTPKSSNKDNAQDDSTASSTDSAKKQTSTQESQSSSVSQSDDTSDSNKSDIEKSSESTSQTKNEKNVNQTAMYNSLTNTDVPAESDDNSPVTPTILIDVSTGDDVNNSTPGDKSLESEQSETDVKITVSAIDDSEDDIIAITIEVSESAGDADSSSDDKSVVIKINTNDSDSADSKTSKANDFEKNQTNKDENTNQNLEIDVTNIEGEPTMWIRTTNQDFIEKLASKNDTQFDVIYFFNMNPQPTIEREKVTTIHCNGTVVIEKTETSYASQDDKTPKVVKTTTVLQIEDYEP